VDYEKAFRDLGSCMNTALIIIGLAMFIFIIVFSLKRAQEKRKAHQEEHEKIKDYGESINEETRNKYK
jgi:preprotein translocase subunit YajC